jgi:hypothetical protein
MAPTTKIVGTKALLWSMAALTGIDVVIAEVPGHLRYDFLIILDNGIYKRVQKIEGSNITSPPRCVLLPG